MSNELDNALKLLRKRFGDNYINYGGKFSYNDYKRVSFGIDALDFATGGGAPREKVITIAGAESAGKTTTVISLAAQVQKQGGSVAWIDVENSLDPVWCGKLGCNYDDILICQPDTIEEVTDTIETLLISNTLDLIVFDSIAASSTKAELENSADKKTMGGKATEIGLMCRKIISRIRGTNCIVVLINQVRQKVQAMGASEYMPGGKQLHNQSDIIIFLRASEWLGSVDEPDGQKTKFRVKKNKTAPPLRTGDYDIYFKGYIDNNPAIIDNAIKTGIVIQKGAWFYLGEEKYHGKDALIEQLGEEGIINLKQQIIEKINAA